MMVKAFYAGLITCASLCGSTAFGVVVNVTESNVPGNVGTLFDSRGFELDTPDTAPSSDFLLPTSPTPSWETSNASSIIQVRSGDRSSVGGPSSGYGSSSNYLQIERPGSATNFNAQFGRTIDPQNESFTVSLAIYMKNFSDDAVQNDPYILVSLQPSTGTGPNIATALAGFGFRYNATTGAREAIKYNGTSISGTLIGTFNADAWNTLEFTWDQGDEAALLSINGAPGVDVFQNNGFTNPVGQILFRHNAANTTAEANAVYVDAVPEPTSLGGLGLAAGTALLRRRRRTV